VNNLANAVTSGYYPNWGDEVQLFSIAADGGEQFNVASDSSFADAL
jgi:hypothetical protein